MHCTCPLLEAKRTCRFAPQMSAFDPKRTFRAYYRSSIDLAKSHNAVAANNKKKLIFDLLFKRLDRSRIPMDSGIITAAKLLVARK